MLSARAGSSDWSNCFDEGAFCHRRSLNISVSFFSARIWSHYSCGAPFLVLVIVMPSFSDIVSSPEESFVIMSCGMLGIALQTLLELEPRTRLRGPWGSVVKYGSIAS